MKTFEVEFDNGHIETFQCEDLMDAKWHVDDILENDTLAGDIIIRLEEILPIG